MHFWLHGIMMTILVLPLAASPSSSASAKQSRDWTVIVACISFAGTIVGAVVQLYLKRLEQRDIETAKLKALDRLAKHVGFLDQWLKLRERSAADLQTQDNERVRHE